MYGYDFTTSSHNIIWPIVKNTLYTHLYIRQAVEFYEEREGQSDTTDSENTESDEEEWVIDLTLHPSLAGNISCENFM